MPPITNIEFDNGNRAIATFPENFEDLPSLLEQLGLVIPKPVLVLVGGAGGMLETDLERLSQFFREVLVPVIEKYGAVLLDGATDSGVVRLLGQTRNECAANFTALGVTPACFAQIPGQNSPTSRAKPLESHHTHFALVPGQDWGEEIPWMSRLASLISDDRPSLTVLVNGGEVAFRDAAESVKAGRPVMVIRGSGRTADIIADALDGNIRDERAIELADSGYVGYLDLTAPVNDAKFTIGDFFV